MGDGACFALYSPDQCTTGLDLAFFEGQVLESMGDLPTGKKAVAQAVVDIGFGPEQVDGAVVGEVEVAVADMAGTRIAVGNFDPCAEGLCEQIGSIGVEKAAKDVVPIAAGDLVLGLFPGGYRFDDVADAQEVGTALVQGDVGIAEAQGLGRIVLVAPRPDQRGQALPAAGCVAEGYMSFIVADVLQIEDFAPIADYRAIGVLAEGRIVVPDESLPNGCGIRVRRFP